MFFSKKINHENLTPRLNLNLSHTYTSWKHRTTYYFLTFVTEKIREHPHNPPNPRTKL